MLLAVVMIIIYIIQFVSGDTDVHSDGECCKNEDEVDEKKE